MTQRAASLRFEKSRRRLLSKSQGRADVKGLLLAAVGITTGLAGAAVLSRFLQGMLFGIAPLDRATFVAVALLFGLVTMAASYIPARRASRVDPMVALRTE